MKRRKYLLLVFFVLTFAFSCRRNDAMPLLAPIPQQAALIVESQSVSEFLQTVRSMGLSDNVLKNSVLPLKLDSMMAEKEALQSDFQAANMAFSLLSIGESYQPLTVLKSSRFSEKELRRVFQSNGILCTSVKCGKQDVSLAMIGDSVFFVGKDGFLLLSSDSRALQQSLAQFDNPEKIYSSADFQQVQSTLGRSFDVHLYLNLNLLHGLLEDEVSAKYKDSFGRFVELFNGNAAFDVLSDASGIVLNGYTCAADSLSNLKPLECQTPVPNTIADFVPDNTQLMVHFGMSDYLSFWENSADIKKVEQTNRKYALNLQNQFVSNISETAFCVFGNKASRVWVVRASDMKPVAAVMNAVADKAGVSATNIVLGYPVFGLNENDFLASLFGGWAEGMKHCCYSIVDQYVVFSNALSTIQDVILAYRSGKTLRHSKGFRNFEDKMLETSNITVFLKGFGNQAFVNDFLAADPAACIKANTADFQSCKGMLLQMVASKELIYTYASMIRSGKQKPESPKQEVELRQEEVVSQPENDLLLWKVELEAPVQGKPFVVSNVLDDKAVAVFDANNTLYLIDDKGEIRWKKSLSAPLLSTVYEVDQAKNGQRQLLFNTAGQIHLIDRDGNDVKGYPKTLPVEAVNGLSLFDYGVPYNYRLMLCASDHSVCNFNLQGEVVEGWKCPVLKRSVSQPVQHLVADNKDYLIVTDKDGGVGIFDRKGRVRIAVPDDLRKAQGSDFYENKTNHRGIMLTTDNDGKLLYVSAEGLLSRTDFGTFSDRHFFLYEDFNGNGDPDFIYLDHKELKVFDRFKKVLFSHAFDADIAVKPQLVTVSGKRFLCLVSPSSGMAYRIDAKGNMETFSCPMDETPSAIGSLQPGKIHLIVGKQGMVCAYELK